MMPLLVTLVVVRYTPNLLTRNSLQCAYAGMAWKGTIEYNFLLHFDFFKSNNRIQGVFY